MKHEIKKKMEKKEKNHLLYIIIHVTELFDLYYNRPFEII